MKKNTAEPNLIVALMNRKKEAQKSGAAAKPFQKFEPGKARNHNGSSVGPCWGPRKGN